MKRYFDARANPVNEELVQRMNKLPTGAARTGEGVPLPAGTLFFKKRETVPVAQVVPAPDRQFLNERRDFKSFGPQTGIAGRVMAKEQARREYEPMEAFTLNELEEMFPVPTGTMRQNEEIKKVLTKEERKAKVTSVLAANRAAYDSGVSFPRLLAPSGNAAPRPPQPPKADGAKKRVFKVKK
tara:strand:- start:368 stop:916 length:549 start_codon:yes stop_codon:yes gene_type:complete